MNSSAPPPECGQYSTSQQRPFFYAQPTTQLPFPNPWYLAQLYNPYCISAPGYRGGNPYVPYYSVPLQEYPGYYVPQHQMNLRMNRRPHFNPHPPSPMFYHATRFRHYTSPGRRTETKETQTEPRQPESVPKKHPGTEKEDCDKGNAVSHSSGISTENEHHLESEMSPVTAMPERDFHKNACNAAQYRNMPPGSYAYEKEEVRIEYGSGSPAAIQMWKSYKETIPIYDVAVVKEIPENVVQRDLFCEGVLYGPHPEEEIAVQNIAFTNTEEHKQLPPPKLCLEVQELETRTSLVQNREPRPESTKQNLRPKIPLEGGPQSVLAEHVDVARPVYDVQQAANEDSEESEDSEETDASEEEAASEKLLIGLDTGPEKVAQSQSVCNGELKVANASVWVEDSVQKFIPSPSWVAWIENQETNYDYDVYMSQRKQKRPSILSITSEELSSRDEGSSLDNASVSYFVPDYLLRKGLYAFRRSAESSEKEKIQSGGSLKEDDLPVKHASSRYEKSCGSSSGRNVKDVSSRSRKIGVPIRGLNKRKLYSVKKKPRKSQSLSEPEDSEEYWVLEEENLHNFEGDETDEEYYFEEDLPREQLDFGKTNFFKQIAQQRILWKPSKGDFPAHLIGWPVGEKLKVKKKSLPEALEQVHRHKACEFANYETPTRDYKEVTEVKKAQQKMGGKPQKKASGATVEEYWVGRGAKPKFAEPAYYLQDAAKIKEQDKPPKKKGTRKSSKRKQTRTDTEEIDAWEIPRSFLYRGRGLRRGGTRKK